MLQVCLSCQKVVEPAKVSGGTKGSFGLEVLLWLLWILPGLLYSLWRRAGGTEYVCPLCGNPNTLDSTNSPQGKIIWREYVKDHPEYRS